MKALVFQAEKIQVKEVTLYMKNWINVSKLSFLQ